MIQPIGLVAPSVHDHVQLGIEIRAAAFHRDGKQAGSGRATGGRQTEEAGRLHRQRKVIA